jgi:hypothetical protein
MSETVRTFVELAFAVAVIVMWIRDQRKDAPRVRAWLVADGVRKLRERAEATESDARSSSTGGYRDAVLPGNVEQRSGVFERMRARRRAKQMLEMERRAGL